MANPSILSKLASIIIILAILVPSLLIIQNVQAETISGYDLAEPTDINVTNLNAPNDEFFSYNGREGIAIWTTSEGVNYILANDPSGFNPLIYTDESGDFVGTWYEYYPESAGANPVIWYDETTDKLCTAYQQSGRYGMVIGDSAQTYLVGADNYQFKVGSDYSFHVLYDYCEYDEETWASTHYYKYDSLKNGVWSNNTLITDTTSRSLDITFDLKTNNEPYFCIMEDTNDGNFAVTCMDGVSGPSFVTTTAEVIPYGTFFLSNLNIPYFVYPILQENDTVIGALGRVTSDGFIFEMNMYGADSIEIAMGIEYTFVVDSIGRIHGIYSLYYPESGEYQLRYIVKDGNAVYQQILLSNETKTFNVDSNSLMIGSDGVLRGVVLDMDTIVFTVIEKQLTFPPVTPLEWAKNTPPTNAYEYDRYDYTFITNKANTTFALVSTADWLNINNYTGRLYGLARVGTFDISINATYDSQSIYHNYSLLVSETPGRAQAVINAKQISTYKVMFNFTTTMTEEHITSIMWDFGDGSVVWYSGEGIGIKAPATLHRYNATGDYHVTLVIEDMNGKSVRATYFIKLNDTEVAETSSYGDFKEFDAFVIKIVFLGLLALIAAALYEATKKGKLSGYHPLLLLLVVMLVMAALAISLMMEGI